MTVVAPKLPGESFVAASTGMVSRRSEKIPPFENHRGGRCSDGLLGKVSRREMDNSKRTIPEMIV
jgi:hypothetical protein